MDGYREAAPLNVTLVLGYLAKGGTERQVAYLSTGLVQRGHCVQILLLGQRLEDEYPIAAAVRVVPLQINKLRHLLGGLRELRSAFRSSDVVYSFLDVANALCALVKPQDGAPLVWGLRAANTSAGWLSQLGLWLSQRLRARADALIANSKAVQAYYQTQSIGGNHSLVIANGVQTRAPLADSATEATAQSRRNAARDFLRKDLRTQLQLPDDSFVALVLARAAVEKRQALGLKLLEHNTQLHLIFAGDGVTALPAQWRSQALATAPMLERCRFLEHRSDVESLLGGVHVLLSLSSAEGFPNSILEAMAHEVPVVATAVGGVVELLVGADVNADPLGWLVPMTNTSADVEALEQALLAVQGNGPEVQQRILAARQRVEEHYSVERMVEQSELLLEQLANPA